MLHTILIANSSRKAGKLLLSAQALAAKIEEAKRNNDKLESENKFLQDYLNNLAQTLSTTTGVKSRKSKRLR